MKVEGIRTLRPYNFSELPPEMKEKAEKMIADISPIGEVNEDTVDAVEAWSREDVLVLMRAMYNEALRQPRPIPSDIQEAADSVAITKSMDYVDGIPDGGTREHPWNDHDVERGYQAGFRDGIGWERERMMKEAVSGLYGEGDFGVPCINLDKHLELDTYQPVSVIIIKKEK